MRIIFRTLALGLLLAPAALKAQTYKNAIGVRLGSWTGVNFKTFVAADRALDLNLSFRDRSTVKEIRFTGLYEVHDEIENAGGLHWYYGAGASIGSWELKPTGDDKIFLSADGVLGLDFKFPQAPINLALDWRPRLIFVPDTDVNAGDVGLAIRFTF